MKEFIATQNDDNKRLSRFVLSVTQNMPNSLLYKSFRNGRIKVNGKKEKADFRVSIGDIISLYINDEFFAVNPNKKEDNSHPNSFSIPPKQTLKILWQNKEIAFLHKPSDMLCHQDGTKKNTLLDQFTNYLMEHNEYNPHTESTFSPSLCNRLDYGTEGIVIAAKTYAALRNMNTLIAEDEIEKQYLCLTIGKPPEGLHKAFLSRDKNKKIVNVTKKEIAGSKNISTGIEVLDTCDTLSLCKITLYTGRTHQIRGHLAFLGFPILGDSKYGNPSINKKFSLKHQALCANEIIFSNAFKTQNSLHYLQGKTFQIEKTEIITLWKKICRQ